MEAALRVRLLRCDVATAYDDVVPSGADDLIVRVVRGRKMRTAQRLFDEFAAAWQFPPYFGENWDAFDECVGDLDQWLPRRRGFVLLVLDAAEVLAEADRPDALSLLVDILGRTAAYFAEPRHRQLVGPAGDAVPRRASGPSRGRGHGSKPLDRGRSDRGRRRPAPERRDRSDDEG